MVSSDQVSGAAATPDAIVAIPVRHYGRWIMAAIVLLLLASLVLAVASNKVFDFAVVPRYLFDPVVVLGVGRTIEMTVLAMAVGITLGLIAAVFRLSPNPVLKWVSLGYVWFFRGTPVLVQLIFWFNLGVVFPTLGLGIPFTSISLWSQPTSQLISPFTAALLGLGLNEGAYMSEIVRSGIISVDVGQSEAALSVGMRRSQVLRHIVLPQALRVIIPPLTSQYLNLTKNSSLAVAIGYPDLFAVFAGTTLNQTGQAIEIIAITMAVYLAISLFTSLLMNIYNARVRLVER